MVAAGFPDLRVFTGFFVSLGSAFLVTRAAVTRADGRNARQRNISNRFRRDAFIHRRCARIVCDALRRQGITDFTFAFAAVRTFPEMTMHIVPLRCAIGDGRCHLLFVNSFADADQHMRPHSLL